MNDLDYTPDTETKYEIIKSDAWITDTTEDTVEKSNEIKGGAL